METYQQNPFWLRLLDLVTGGVAAGVIAYLVTGGFSPVLTGFLLSYLYFGKAKYGPLGPLTSFDDVKASLFASLAWPYLAWKKLDRDLQTPSSVTYDAYVNEVFVGELSDPDYSAIKRQVLRDPRLYFAQVLNLGWVGFKALDTFFLGIPMLAFWGLIALAYFAPETYGEILTTIQNGPEAIRDFASRYMGLLIQVWFLALLVQAVARGHVPGFTNVFAQATTRHLRRKLRVAAEGEVVLHPHVVLPAAPAPQQ
ncbi:MAG: hypothetical protein KJ716_13175 [Gammaproteobacteria bacterium]|nr:hypothetical protein [Gammaproteobacteria bacterium]MBU2451613.1 hypothetical protein [Gammaproteobacteria bacterium]